MSRRRRVAPAVVLPVLLAGSITACGEPTAQVVEAGQGQVTFEMPAEFTDLALENAAGSAFGLPDSLADQLNNDPVLYLRAESGGESTSYQSLRAMVTGGQYDPLDPDMAEVASASGTAVIDYQEINQPEVWGIRMQVAVGRGALDFQALVHRRSGEVVVTELVCTQACFLEQFELIDQIQGSWSLET